MKKITPLQVFLATLIGVTLFFAVKNIVIEKNKAK